MTGKNTAAWYGLIRWTMYCISVALKQIPFKGHITKSMTMRMAAPNMEEDSRSDLCPGSSNSWLALHHWPDHQRYYFIIEKACSSDFKRKFPNYILCSMISRMKEYIFKIAKQLNFDMCKHNVVAYAVICKKTSILSTVNDFEKCMKVAVIFKQIVTNESC